MNRSSRALRGGVAAAVLGWSLLAAAAPASSSPSAPAAPAPLQASGPFSASADASLLRIDLPALSPPLLPQTNVDVARSTALADSDGDVDDAEASAQRTGAFAGTTGTSSLLGQPLAIQENRASAPPSESNAQTLAEIPGEPLLFVELIKTLAAANWVSDTECTAAADPLSLADQELTDVTLIAPEEGQSVVATDEGEDGAADVEASTLLPATGGANDQRAIAATVTARLAGADVLNNFSPDLASLINVRVVRAPNYTVSATGVPGGASVTGDDPVVDVIIGDQPVIELNANSAATAPIGLALTDLIDVDGALAPLLDPLSPLVRLSVPVNKTTAADGTSASVTAAILKVEILPPDVSGELQPVADALAQALAALGLDITKPLGVIELAPMAASVTAPAGGIFCGADNNPVELSKVNSGPAIPGQSFDYTIRVGNVGDCTLQNVAVTDVVTGPAGTTIVATDPTATSVGAPTAAGSGLESTQVSWANIGPIAPDQSKTLTIKIQVPASATVGQRYTDTVSVSAQCDGRTVTRTFTLNEPPVEAPGTGPCNLTGSNKSTSHLEVYRGEHFDYFINVFNDAAQPCTDVTVTDTLIEKVTFVSCNNGCTTSGRTVTWTIPTLAPGQSITLRVTVSVNADATGTLPDTAVIDTPATNPVTVNTPGPTVTDRSVLAPNAPAGRAGVADLARTGPTAPLAWPAALGLGVVAMAAQRLRRRSVTT